MVYTARLRSLKDQRAARISPTVTYLSVHSTAFSQTISLLLTFLMWFYWSILPAISYALAFAPFAAFPVAERLGGARDVQLMTGMSSAFFLFAHLVFDWICYMIVMTPLCIIHYIFSNYSATTARFISVITYMAVVGMAKMNVRPLFMAFPPFSLIAILVKVSQLDFKATNCKGVRTADDGGGETTGLGTDPMGSLSSSSCAVTTPFSFSGDGILIELLCVLGESAVFFAVLTALLSGYSLFGRQTASSGEVGHAEDDVEQERRLVNTLRDQKKFSGHALVAWNLHKRYGALHAVRGVHLALRPGECFGLLGVNGAGKTTTFQMLAGLTKITFGDAYTESATLSENLRKWQSAISYCFQMGGLLDRLNAYDYLYLIGRLRGIPEKDLKAMVESVISVVDLQPHASKECGVYSGGNRRKLAIGAALLGLPPIVFLDEPYAGVDVVSRTKIFKAISLIKQKSQVTIVLTSHNMDECEVSCDRLTIMVRGQMMCLGTVQHLRNRYGKGYRLEFMLKHKGGVDPNQFMQAVPGLFPGIVLTDFHENVYSYHLEERVPWSTLFENVAILEKDFTLEHAMVGDNTLEQIFIAFAKGQDNAVANAHGV
ncbi:ATP-binding cassette sub-family A member 17-like [Haemaphysalis longicornis]